MTCAKFDICYRADSFGSLSGRQIFFQGISKYIPPPILRYLGDSGNGPRLMRVREARSIALSVAKEMVQEKGEMLLQGKGSRDLFSLLGVCAASFWFNKSNERT